MSQACYATSHWDSESALDALSEVYSSRSSFTYYASRAEEEFERYGGNDDIYGPPLKTEVITTPSDLKDSDLVDWDGPGDQENPQNWSLKYKWFTTFICLLMTVNVCVFGEARRILFSCRLTISIGHLHPLHRLWPRLKLSKIFKCQKRFRI